MAISFHDARPRLPKVQNTTEAIWILSVAKYWIIIVPAENKELKATPAKTIASGVNPRNVDYAKIKNVASNENTKAVTVTE